MTKLTITFGVVLIALGVAFFVMTGSVHKTALIPAWFGIALAVSGALANSEDSKRRMLWMHIAVAVGLVGFLFPGIRGGMALVRAHSTGVALSDVASTAVHEELFMAGICLIFVLLCVRSFITARRSREA
jgi:hypothetical protein